MKHNIANLIFRLQKEALSTKEISDIYNINIRTAQRYIKTIKESGFIIKNNNNKYRIINFLDNDSEIVLDMMDSIFQNNAFEKIKKSLNHKNKDVFYLKINIEKTKDLIEKFLILEEAITNNKIIKISYKTKKKNIVEFQIKPLKVVNFEGYWYLFSLNENDEYRKFYIKDIKKIDITSQTFENKEINLEEAMNIWFDPTKETIQVELFADKEATKYLQRLPLSKTQKLFPNADGSSVIYLEITDKMEILRKLLMWIPNLVVIEPKWLKEEVDSMIDRYIERFRR